MEQVGGVYLFFSGELTLIGANCSRCAIRSRSLPTKVQQKATFVAGRKAAESPVKYPTRFFESPTHAKMAYRLLVDVTPEERLAFFTVQN